MAPHSAILLLGPTGAGKTPLGEYLQVNGLWGRRCAHFDFGAQLRAAAESRPAQLSDSDMSVIRDSLRTGALLEDRHFPIAARILRAFIATRTLRPDDLVALNGLPRHIGQARDIDAIVAVKLVVSLHCTPEVVFARIGSNAGGDRTGRVDDDLAAIRSKLAVFAARTAPLIMHYGDLRIRVCEIEVAMTTAPAEIYRQLPAGSF